MREWCAAIAGGVRLTLLVAPNARKTEIVGIQGGALKIRLQAQPVDGKANEALIRYIAEILQVPKSSVSLAHGQASRQKMIDVLAPKLSLQSVRHSLNQAVGSVQGL